MSKRPHPPKIELTDKGISLEILNSILTNLKSFSFWTEVYTQFHPKIEKQPDRQESTF